MINRNMKIKVSTIAILVMLAVISCDLYSQEKNIDTRKLTWADFKGKPDDSSRYDSYTYWNVYYKYDAPVIEGNKVKIKFRVWNELGNNSWVKFNTPREYQKPELLNHEQGHYNIGAICALEVKKKFVTSTYSIKSYHQEIKKIFDQTFQGCVDWEKKYDNETKHMYNRTAQKKWDALFQKKLNELNQYKYISTN